MIGHASIRQPLANSVPIIRRPTVAPWQRRAVETGVSILAFAVWGKLAYIGGYRLLARLAGVPLGGHVILDLMSLLIGVSGSIAGVSALWALAMRAAGRTPSSLIGDPDDNAVDAAYRDGTLDLQAVADALGRSTAPRDVPL
ncbi:hypothetical protein tb265_18870 [Gemmatimonadetes bacterium T265]|nr:hypothetical protein tb265_18870 [Gemmatimonadetes bacterium T265]